MIPPSVLNHTPGNRPWNRCTRLVNRIWQPTTYISDKSDFLSTISILLTLTHIEIGLQVPGTRRLDWRRIIDLWLLFSGPGPNCMRLEKVG